MQSGEKRTLESGREARSVVNRHPLNKFSLQFLSRLSSELTSRNFCRKFISKMLKSSSSVIGFSMYGSGKPSIVFLFEHLRRRLKWWVIHHSIDIFVFFVLCTLIIFNTIPRAADDSRTPLHHIRSTLYIFMYTRIETLSCFIFILKQAYRYTRLLVFSLSRGTFEKKSWKFPFPGHFLFAEKKV
jgi:hypothetical protein